MNVESTPRALMVALCVALACSALVTGAVHFLRPLQNAHTQLERNRAVVEAAGKLPPGDVSAFEVLALFRELDATAVDIESGDIDSDVDVTHSSGADNTTNAIVYLSRRDSKLERAILPVEGAGMWSTIYGYVAISVSDLRIADVVFYRHGETPGIGDRIQQLDWRKQWQGKLIYNAATEAIFDVVKNATGPYQVDAISGATVTSLAVGQFVRGWMDKPGYKAFLQRIQIQGAP